MPDQVADKEVPTPIEDFNAGFTEGMADTVLPDVDPLDFDDKPVPETVDEVEEVEGDPGEGTKGEVTEKEEPTSVVVPEPAKDYAAEVAAMLDKRLPKEQPLEQPKAPVKAEKEPEPEKAALTDEETTRLKELSGEWGDVSEMLALQLKTVSKSISQEVAKQIADARKEFADQLQPVQRSVETSAAQRYDAAVQEKHPEVYDKVHSKVFGDELVAWVNGQPDYLRDAYAQAFSSENPEDAIDLITRFKAETGKVVESTEEASLETADSPADTDTKSSKSKRLKLMAAPTSRQTKVTDGDDPSDFEGGFNEIARQLARAK